MCVSKQIHMHKTMWKNGNFIAFVFSERKDRCIYKGRVSKFIVVSSLKKYVLLETLGHINKQ